MTSTQALAMCRGVEYELDLDSMTAEKVWEYVQPDGYFTPSIGWIQRLTNGNTLINFGNLQHLGLGSIVTEVTPDNEVVFQLEYDGSCEYLDGICETCEDGFVIENDDDNDGICNEDEIDSVLNLSNPERSLIKVTNLLGQEVEVTLNTPMLFIYDNGSVEQRFQTE